MSEGSTLLLCVYTVCKMCLLFLGIHSDVMLVCRDVFMYVYASHS